MAGFRTVVIQSPCKLTYKDGFLIIRGDEVRTVHISELHTLILDTTMVTLTGYLICELMHEKVNVIFCDEKRNPCGQVLPYAGSHDTAARMMSQANWSDARKAALWQQIIQQKILNQAGVMQEVSVEAARQIAAFAETVTPGDATNREGHAAKVYFNRIFGKDFSRDLKSDRNAALNYGYSLLLSCFNKEVTARGYATQLGIHHRNAYNSFNLSCDLMEPFRFLVDEVVLHQGERTFDKEYKYELLDILNTEICYQQQKMYVSTAIARFVRNTTDYLDGQTEWTEGMMMHYEDASHESHRDV